MYYTTIPVRADIGHEAKAIDATVQEALRILSEEAGSPVVLTNIIPVLFPALPAPCVCLVVMARKYEEPAIFAGVPPIPDALTKLLMKREA